MKKGTQVRASRKEKNKSEHRSRSEGIPSKRFKIH